MRKSEKVSARTRVVTGDGWIFRIFGKRKIGTFKIQFEPVTSGAFRFFRWNLKGRGNPSLYTFRPLNHFRIPSCRNTENGPS